MLMQTQAFVKYFMPPPQRTMPGSRALPDQGDLLDKTF
jgi:hypothetical protein